MFHEAVFEMYCKIKSNCTKRSYSGALFHSVFVSKRVLGDYLIVYSTWNMVAHVPLQ